MPQPRPLAPLGRRSAPGLDGRMIAAFEVVPRTTRPYELSPIALIWETLLLALRSPAAAYGYGLVPRGPFPTGAEVQWLVSLGLVYIPAVVTIVLRRNRQVTPLLVPLDSAAANLRRSTA